MLCNNITIYFKVICKSMSVLDTTHYDLLENQYHWRIIEYLSKLEN